MPPLAVNRSEALRETKYLSPWTQAALGCAVEERIGAQSKETSPMGLSYDGVCARSSGLSLTLGARV